MSYILEIIEDSDQRQKFKAIEAIDNDTSLLYIYEA